MIRKKSALYSEKETGKIKIRDIAIVYLLGVVSGHWDYLLNNPKSGIASHKDIERLNRGIAIITPIKHVMEILMYDELKEQRKKDDESIRRKTSKKEKIE